MFKPKAAFSGFSIDDVDKAKKFYTEVLGLEVRDDFGGVRVFLPNGNQTWMYSKKDHQPAAYTMLNFIVDDINAAVDELTKRGVTFERYDGMEQDERGIARGLSAGRGTDITWFKDPAGNIMSVLQTADA
jgi:catechol 2,3-dioxygenase-like lactoylglutathione lyase family enzyme